METLVVVAQHRNHHQYYGQSSVKSHGETRFRFGSVPSRGINCRSYQSGAGILPTPFKAFSTPETKHTPSQSHSKTTPIDIVNNMKEKDSVFIASESGCGCGFECEGENLSFCELWAGPTYSNSPPPSSLPIPKFSLRPKRTVSLELPSGSAMVANDAEMGFHRHSIAKSAPTSPTREHGNCTRDMFATKTLRRILNLDVDDDE